MHISTAEHVHQMPNRTTNESQFLMRLILIGAILALVAGIILAVMTIDR